MFNCTNLFIHNLANLAHYPTKGRVGLRILQPGWSRAGGLIWQLYLLPKPPSRGTYKSPYKQIMRKLEVADRMIAWSIELLEFRLKYEPRGPLKAKCLFDFMAKLSSFDEEPKNKE